MSLDGTAFAAFAILGGPVMFAHGFTAWRRRRLIADTPTSKVRSMAMGLVEVTGTVTPRSSAEAPFSGKPCVFWKVDVSTRGRSSWTVIHRESSSQPFYLRDDTGLALVFPEGADTELNAGVEEVCNGIALPDAYAEYLRTHPTVLGPFARFGELRFRETIVEEGFPLYVLGTATPKARVLELSDDEGLAATGTDGPGAVAMRAVRLHQLDGEVRGTIRRGDPGTTFIISERSQTTLMDELGVRATAFLVLGPVITLLGLSFWLFDATHGRWP